MNSIFPSSNEIIAAHKRIESFIHKTPILTSRSIDAITGTKLFFKCENFQKVGAFKMRGASNAILSLSEQELNKGVATHSSGNHAAAIALAAKLKGVKAFIVMPNSAPEIKKAAVKEYEGEIIYSESTLTSREAELEKVLNRTGAVFIHPFNNNHVIEGQATCAKEVFDELNFLNFIIAPVGGGGLLSGTCLSAKYFSPHTKVIGAEPAGADDAFKSIRDSKVYPSVNPNTIADGLLTSLSDKTYNIIKQHVESILTVEDNLIIEAMKLIWERMKIIVEPSGAVPLAVVLKHRELFAGQNICLIISGGNIDLKKLPW
ncbi:MAG: serine dehydratase [Ignavibacteriae bacterium HGW-Ignavibacteriae-2]|jgi:threonine dehydratase|nr:MAG: serine dehydratase [Ignavibacteriae bacterium HGW-Ignavibacteriae-2]